MEGHPADHLNIEMAQSERPFTDFAADRKRIGKHLIQSLTRGNALAELIALGR